MCFYDGDDYDWYAEISELSEETAPKAFKCAECRRPIEAGERCQELFQQEAEECKACEDCECDCVDWDADNAGDHECKCEDPNFGESFTGYRCLECANFLKAIEQVEIDEKCPQGERQPLWGEMIESISQFEREDAIKYFRKASRMFPELKASGYLRRMWGRMFDRRRVLARTATNRHEPLKENNW